MSIEKEYNEWASQYDSNLNPTRDLEGYALRKMLNALTFDRCLEMGCGTGKNTVWLKGKARHITAVDFSAEMLNLARQKFSPDQIEFVQADISRPWDFLKEKYDLVSFSLVLEHIIDLLPVFREAAKWTEPKGYLYVGELHPFKQYSGSKARFDTPNGTQVVDCYNHHISDFIQSTKVSGWNLLELKEFFDNPEERELPRLLTMIFQK